MMIYWSCFLVSILLTNIGLSIKKNYRIIRLLLFCGAVSLPCILAGVRGNYIGTDMQVYILPVYKMAINSSSFSAFCKTVATRLDIVDYLYLLVNYLAVKAPCSRFILLASLEALIIIPIYIALIKGNKKNKHSVILGQFIFFAFLYNASYNMVRQSIAIAFVTLAIYYLIEDKKKHFVAFVLVAALFHSTAFIIIGAYLIYIFYKTKRIPGNVKKILLSFSIILAGVLVINSTRLLRIMSMVGILSQKRTYSINSYLREADFSFSNTFLYLVIYWMMYINRKKVSSLLPLEKAYRYIFALGIIVSQVGMYVTYADRLAFYFLYPIIFTVLPKISVEKFGKGHSRVMISEWLIIGLFILYWTWWIGVLNYHATLPYVMFTG